MKALQDIFELVANDILVNGSRFGIAQASLSFEGSVVIASDYISCSS